MNVRHLDLNLLLILEALYLERSVTRASQRLGLTQPAVSNALRRLRLMFDDPLFVRTADGMTPTQRALAVGPAIQASLDSLRQSIGSGGFDPERSVDRFVVGALDHVDALHIAPLVQELRNEAPGIRIRVRKLHAIFNLPQEELESGAMDCAISQFPHPLPPSSPLRGMALGNEGWVCIGRKGHPAFKGILSAEAYAALDHIGINVGTDIGWSGIIDRKLAERGLSRRTPIVVPSFMTVPFHVASSDCIATVPRRLAEIMARALPLQIAEAPDVLPAYDWILAWHRRSDGDPAHRWFRQRVAAHFKGEASA